MSNKGVNVVVFNKDRLAEIGYFHEGDNHDLEPPYSAS